MVLPDVDVSEIQLPSLSLELEKDLVKFIKLLGVAIGLYRDIVVGNGRLYFNAVAQHTAQLKIQGRVQYGILAITKTNLATKASLGFEGSKVEYSFLLVGQLAIKFKRSDIKFIQYTIIAQALGHGIQFVGKYPVAHSDAITGGSFGPDKRSGYKIQPVIARGNAFNDKGSGYDAGGIQSERIALEPYRLLAEV